MNRQRGFIQLSMMMWGAIAAGAVILSLTGAVYVQTLRLGTCKAEFAEFKGGVAALGKAAELAAKDRAMKDKLFKENIDAQNTRALADLGAVIKRLRNDNASRSRLPPAAPTSSRPDLACFDRTEYQRADGIAVEKLFAGARGLADEGTKNTVDLDTAKYWGKGR